MTPQAFADMITCRQYGDELTKEERPLFLALLKASNLPTPVAEHRFCERRWRFDYAWPDQKLALEVEGGVWTGGRHTRGKGFIEDMTKYNRATALGWRVIRCTPSTLCSNETLGLIKEILK